jgi:DNA-binding MarR family transcriptional regulator
MAVRDLADQLLLTHSAAVQTENRLVTARLVQREAAPDDGRVVLVTLTKEGRRRLGDLVEHHVNELLRRERDLLLGLRRIKTAGHPRRVGERPA